MKHLKLFENFKNIDQICRKYGIGNYTINQDGTVDVDGDVNLSYKGECPHIIKNKHNDMIVNFGKKMNMKHNCHMTKGVKDLWNVTDEKLECFGSKNDI